MKEWRDRKLPQFGRVCLIPLELLFSEINELYLVYFADPNSDPSANPFEAALTNPKLCQESRVDNQPMIQTTPKGKFPHPIRV